MAPAIRAAVKRLDDALDEAARARTSLLDVADELRPVDPGLAAFLDSASWNELDGDDANSLRSLRRRQLTDAGFA